MRLKNLMSRQFPRWLACVGLVFLSACSALPSASAKGNTTMNTNDKIESLFTHTKDICFGRYVLTVPQDAVVSYGVSRINSQPSRIYPNRAKETKQIIEEWIKHNREKNKSAKLLHHGQGPITGSYFMSGYEDEVSAMMGDGSLMFATPVGTSAFYFGEEFQDRELLAKVMPGKDVQEEADKNNVPKTEQEAMNRVMEWVRKTRPRSDDEVPPESGFCLPYGFIQENTYKYREEVQIGIRFPSLPDVSFSINSKNAGDLDGENGWGILKRVRKQQTLSGDEYDGHFLRIGKAPLQTWKNGEEILARVKSTGGLQFRWGQVGVDSSVVNPNELDAMLYTKVKGESVGASNTTSVTDEEAVALWDKLLKSFRFRVPIKGAP